MSEETEVLEVAEESVPQDIDFFIAIGQVKITESYQFAVWLDGMGQIDTIMSPEEQGIVSRVLRRARKEYHLKQAALLRDEL